MLADAFLLCYIPYSVHLLMSTLHLFDEFGYFIILHYITHYILLVYYWRILIVLLESGMEWNNRSSSVCTLLTINRHKGVG